MAETARDLLQSHPADAPAILAPERPTLTFGGLRELADAVESALLERGGEVLSRGPF